MPTGTCHFPEHHGGPGAGAPVGLLMAVGAGAVIVLELRTVLVVLAVVGVLAVAAGLVAMLVHSHRTEPYDAAWSASEPQTAAVTDRPSVTASVLLQARVDQLERELAERRAIEAPAQHLHLHGVSPAEVAEYLGQLPIRIETVPGGRCQSRSSP
jgi:hypothetical protein